MYKPDNGEFDFEDDLEMGRFGDRLKKFGKKLKHGLAKVEEYTITKPTVAIAGAVGGKKGREWGKKIAKITNMATTLGVGAAALPVLADPTVATTLTAGATGLAAKKLADKVTKKRKKTKAKAKGHAKKAAKKHAGKSGHSSGVCNADNALAAKVAADLAIKLGGPLGDVRGLLKQRALQTQATYEHQKLMGDAEFRRKVLTALAAMAKGGDETCERTVRVVMGAR